MKANKKYLVAVALLAVLAVVFGLAGTVAPALDEASSQQSSSSYSSSSVAHFQNPPTYDSGWVDIRAKAGEYVTLTHGLNTTEVVVYITGKQSLIPPGALEWNKTYGGTGDDNAWSLVQTSDGGYALAGQTYSYGAGNGDFWLVKVYGEMNVEHQRNLGTEAGLTWTALTNNTIILYRGSVDPYWNYIRVRIWLIKEPSWIYGDINMDGIVDVKDLYIIGRNYGKTFSLLSLSGIIAIAGIHTIKKRKQHNN